MSIYRSHAPQPSVRHNELLEQLRGEYESQVRANEALEQQIAQQLNESNLIREKVYQLEQNHINIKQKYEEDVQLLRRQLEAARSGGPPQPGMGGMPQHGPPSVPPPPSLGGGNNLFQGIMAGQGGSGGLPPQPPPQEQQSLGPGPGAGLGPSGPHQQMPHPPPAGLQGPPPPPPPPPSQQPPFQQPYQQGPGLSGFPGQPPQNNPSPGPGKRGIGRPPTGPATPQINNPMPYPPGASPQVQNHPTPDHRAGPMPPHALPPNANNVANNALGELDVERLPPHVKKTRDDWWVVYNQHVPRVLDVELVHTLVHESVVCCVRFSHDGKYVATGCNRSAQIYDVNTGEKVCVLQDETADLNNDLYIRSVCFSPDGRYLATGAEDKLIRVWDITSRTIRTTFSGHEQDIYSLDFARDGRTIASGSGDRTVRLWDIETGNSTLTLSIEDGVTTVAISPDTKYVAAGSLDKSVRVWDIHQGYLLERLEGADGHKDSVYSVAFSPQGKELVSGSLDKTIKMWELASPRAPPGSSSHKGGRCIRTFEGHRDFVLSVALTPDARWVLSGSKDRGVQFWDPHTGNTQLMLQGHKNSVISVAPGPTNELFATGSGDMRARIWRYFRIQ